MRSNHFDVNGRVVIVTGASRGIGRALARGFANAGASVVATARDETACHLLVDEIAAAGGSAIACPADLGECADHAKIVRGAIDRFGRLDVLVNNAGLLLPHHTVKVTEDEIDRMIAVNLKGPLFLSVAALEHLAADGGGSIVNVGALGATQPIEGIGAYCAVKAAMSNWSTVMAREWASLGVRVNVLVPGSVATDMILPKDATRRSKFVAEMAARNVFGRLAEPEELVGAALFLASNASGFMTGRSVYVDGGLLR